MRPPQRAWRRCASSSWPTRSSRTTASSWIGPNRAPPPGTVVLSPQLPEGVLWRAGRSSPPTDWRSLVGKGLSAARVHDPPGTRRAAGGWMRLSACQPCLWSAYSRQTDRQAWQIFRVRPAFQQTVRTAESTTTKVDVLSGAYLSPVRCDAVRSSIGSGGLSKATAGCQPAVFSYNLTRGRMGARVTGIGNARGVSRRTVLGRRHLFSC